MKKHQKLSILPALLLFLVVLSIMLTACSSGTASSAPAPTATPTSSNIDKTSSPAVTPSPTTPAATPTPSPTPQQQITKTDPTPTPVPTRTVTVIWNSAPTTMYATGWSNVRNIPDTAGTLLRTLAPAASVTVYGKAEGQALGNGAIWYRLSGKGSSPQYVYGGLLTTQKPVIDGGGTNLPGKVIKVSLAQQKLYAYNNGQLVFSALVATGRPELPTPAGTYHIFVKQSPTTFYSPWPEGSPYYYPPTHINYAMEFKEGGFYLHDATWRYAFGPGSNVPHPIPGGGTETGTHGCVTMTLANAAWLYQWAPIGTTVIIY